MWYFSHGSLGGNYRKLRSKAPQADIRMTRAIIDIASPLGISVHNHIIVGKNGRASIKGLRPI